MRERGVLVALGLVLLAGVAALIVGIVSCQGGDGAEGSTVVTGPTPGDRSPFVAVLLPETSSPRWVTQDRPVLEQTLSDAGMEHSIDNAGGDSERQQEQAREALARATVLLVAPVDAVTGTAIVAAARAEGVPVIEYDRVSTGEPGPDYFVGYDNEAVGRMLGEGLVRCLGDRGLVNARVAELDGPPTDGAAQVLKEGYDAVLEPRFAEKSFVKVAEEAVPAWDSLLAAGVLDDVLDRIGPALDGVLTPSDELAAGAIEALAGRRLNGIPVTGAGATLEAVQRVLAGDQCLTVYRPVAPEASDAAFLAAQVARGDVPDLQTSVLVGSRRIPAVVHQAVPITNDIQLIQDTVVHDRFLTWEQICTARYEQFCPPPSQRGSG
ncbi:MAG: substrate-binding domain-containing protein [Gaiellaceae bacterium]